MNETKYLVDNNALITLSVRRVGSEFFRSNCHVTPDVLFEASEHPEERVLREGLVEFSSATFEHIRQIMKNIAAGDIRLVDLYKNLGAADPGLVAFILEKADEDDGLLLPNKWILVTRDRAVRDLALSYDIAVMEPGELSDLIDGEASGSE